MSTKKIMSMLASSRAYVFIDNRGKYFIPEIVRFNYTLNMQYFFDYIGWHEINPTDNIYSHIRRTDNSILNLISNNMNFIRVDEIRYNFTSKDLVSKNNCFFHKSFYKMCTYGVIYPHSYNYDFIMNGRVVKFVAPQNAVNSFCFGL